MNRIQEKCEELAKNYEIMRKGNQLEHTSLVAAGAAMFVAAGKEADAERLLACRKLIKQRKGIFSNFRGYAEFVIRCKMALAEDPEAYLNRLDEIYAGLKNFFSTSQTVLAAVMIADLTEPVLQMEAVKRTKEIYKEMEKAHFFMTSQDDMPFAALMAAMGRDSASVYEEAEKIYAILKTDLRATGETRQMLSHILSIYPGPAEARCAKLCSIAEGLKEAGHALSRNRYMAVIGTLAASQAPTEQIVSMIGEADGCLKQYRPFKGIFGVGRNFRRMVAVQMAAAVLEEQGASPVLGAAGVSSMISSSIEVAIITLVTMYAIIASASASSASNNS